MKDGIWKWVAGLLAAFLIGGGASTLVGGSAAGRVQTEMDKRSDYTARVHMSIRDDVEDLEKVNIQILQSLARIEERLKIQAE